MKIIDSIKYNFSAETALILIILRVYFKKIQPQEFEAYLLANEIDWEKLYFLVRSYEIVPIIYKTLLGNHYLINSDFLSVLKQDYLYTATRNLARVKETFRLQALFKEKGIKTIPFKGVFLSHLLFDDYGIRETCDLDFLILPADSALITHSLTEYGYKTDFYFKEANESYVTRTSCERPFYKLKFPEGSVEIHWRVLPRMLDVPYSNEEVFRGILQSSGKEPGLHLSLESTLTTLICHHGVGDTWRTLKHFVDLAAFMDKFEGKVDWKSIDQFLIEKKIKKVSQVGFEVADELFGIGIPPTSRIKVKKEVQMVISNLFNLPMLPKKKYSIRNIRQHLAMRDNIKDKVKLLGNYIKILFIPSPDDLKFLPLPKPLFLLYFIIKPFRLLKNRIYQGKIMYL